MKLCELHKKPFREAPLPQHIFRNQEVKDLPHDAVWVHTYCQPLHRLALGPCYRWPIVMQAYQNDRGKGAGLRKGSSSCIPAGPWQ